MVSVNGDLTGFSGKKSHKIPVFLDEIQGVINRLGLIILETAAQRKNLHTKRDFLWQEVLQPTLAEQMMNENES